MEETLKLIADRLTKDCYDYLAMFAPLLLSIVAIIVAIIVPTVIANKQNKIALFDKRFTAYEVLQKYKAFASMIRCDNIAEKYKTWLVTIFFDDDEAKLIEKNYVYEIEKISTPFKYMPFFYKTISKKEIEEIILNLCRFAAAITSDIDTKDCKQQFLDSIERFCNRHEEEINNMLNLKK